MIVPKIAYNKGIKIRNTPEKILEKIASSIWPSGKKPERDVNIAPIKSMITNMRIKIIKKEYKATLAISIFLILLSMLPP
jgi:hypothetical protein